MRESLRLHQSLYRHQKARIARYLEGASPAFQVYEARYRRRTARYRASLRPEEVLQEITRSDLVYVGDYHTLRQAQQGYLSLVEDALKAGRRVVMALEFVEGRHQEALDAYLAGKMKARTFREQIGHAPQGGFALWDGFSPLLDFARKEKLQILALDRRARGSRSLEMRDRYAARRIAQVARAEDRPLVMVLMGQFHIAPSHLPAQVEAALGQEKRQHLVIYQNAEGVYWQLAREGRLGEVDAVRLSARELCLINASPVLCQQSFLDYLEAESGDEPLLARTAPERFREMARRLARLLGVRLDEHLASVDVLTASDPQALDRIAQRGDFTPKELLQIRAQLLAREGYYLPRARLAYLGTLSLNLAAEEAAHCVRHGCVGEAMERPRRPTEAFYARCLEEALGFFGSKVVNPQRRCLSLSDWAQAFEREDEETRQIAAFVLAHKAAEEEHGEGASKLLPLHADGLFHGVSHALGYLLGDALYRAFDAGGLPLTAIRSLFQDRFMDPRARYLELIRAHALPRRGPKRLSAAGMDETEGQRLALDRSRKVRR